MKFLRLLFSLGAFAVSLPAALAADQYEVRVDRPFKAGERFDLSGRVGVQVILKVGNGGEETLDDKKVLTCRFQSEMTVLDVTKQGFPREVRLVFREVEARQDGEPAALFKNGDVVTSRRVMENDKGVDQVQVNGEEATEEQDQLLSVMISTTAHGESTPEGYLDAKQPVEVGAEWPVDKEMVLRDAKEHGITGMKAEDIQGTVKLEEKTRVDDQPALKLSYRMKNRGKDLGYPFKDAAKKLKVFRYEMHGEMDLPVDLTSQAYRDRGAEETEFTIEAIEDGSRIQLIMLTREAYELTMGPAK